MQAKPNKTVVCGKVSAVRPAVDGWGAEVDLQVERNESPLPEEDFLRPAAGSILSAFTAEPEKVRVGQVVRAELCLFAGPTGGRAVVQSVQPAND